MSSIVMVLLSCANCAIASPSSYADQQPALEASDAEPAVEAVAVAVELRGSSPVMPRGLTSFGATVSDDALYVLGGYFGRPHEYSEAGQTGELLRLDLINGEWSRLGTREQVQSVAMVDHDGTLIRVGGMRALNREGTPANLRSVDTVEAFDIATSRWSSLPAMPSPRSSHDAVVLDDSVWVVGGWKLEGDTQAWHQSILRLDLKHPESGWSEFSAPFKRRALAVAAAAGRIVVMGGMDSERNISDAVDVYDPFRDQWSRGPQFPGPGFGMAATAADDMIVASGMDGVVYRWRPGDPAWERAATLAYPRFFHRLVPTDDGEVLALGGIRTMATGTRVRPIEEIGRVSSQHEVGTLSYELKSPLPSKNRQGIALLDDTLFLFGGNKSLGQHDFEPEFFTDVAYALDLASMQWRSISPYPHPRQTMSTFVTPWGQIVAVGGFGPDGEVARSHPELFAYHPQKDQWRPIGLLPAQGRTQFSLALHDDEVLIFGGLDYDPRRPQDDRFRHEVGILGAPLAASGMEFLATGSTLREPRRAFAGAMLEDRYYIVGGMKEGFELVDSCEAYDFGDHTWTTIACPHHPRLSAQMTALDGKLYLAAGSSVFGPERTISPDSSLEVYDPHTDRWSMLAAELPIEPKHMTMLPYRDRLLLVSTHNDEGRADIVLLDPKKP